VRIVVYYNGESESYREEMRCCRCYEGQRVEACPSGGRVVETKESICMCDRGSSGRGAGEREGEGTQTLSLSSGTHRIHNSLAEHAGRLPVVELREPRNLCV
jgi:hypothetical protein